MSRYLVLNTVKPSPGVEYRKGNVAELTSAQVTALGATNFRLVSTSVLAGGAAPSSPTHDTLGEASGVSNSS